MGFVHFGPMCDAVCIVFGPKSANTAERARALRAGAAASHYRPRRCRPLPQRVVAGIAAATPGQPALPARPVLPFRVGSFYYNGMYYMIVEDRQGVKDMLEGHPIPADKLKKGGYRLGLSAPSS